jgi:serine/threonine protein kinase
MIGSLRPTDIITSMTPRETTSASARIEGVLRNLANNRGDRELVEDIVAARLFAGVQQTPEIGRFTLQGLLGRGGMGTVYAAHDPDFDRQVAIKVVRNSPASDEPMQVARARLLREARILARLDHPNIVKIHESGLHGDDVFVVMEFIEGESLAEWAVGRTWTEIVAMYVQAGEGLAAAHAAGLVHRDFKPDNVIVDRDGRPRVVDFGLARVIDVQALARLGPTSGSAIDYSVTATGRVCGTPGYIAPELLQGSRANPATDLYAFCIALLEALNPDVADPKRKPPAVVLDLLLRGLAPDPSARWASMDALLVELRRASGRPDTNRRRILMAATATALLAVFTTVVLQSCG